MGKEIKMICCKIGCEKRAIFNIQYCGDGDNFEDYVHSCSKHLHEFIEKGIINEVSIMNKDGS